MFNKAATVQDLLTAPHCTHTKALDDIKTSGLRSSPEFQRYLLVNEATEPVKLLQHLLLAHHKAFANVVAKAEPAVDDVVHSVNEERNEHL